MTYTDKLERDHVELLFALKGLLAYVDKHRADWPYIASDASHWQHIARAVIEQAEKINE